MRSGIFLLDKESGQSSAQAIAAIKRKLKLEKIGHAGTLDPMATGLLVCLAGRATKLAGYAQAGRKSYSGTILFGTETDSHDTQGRIVRTSDNIPAEEEILRCAARFLGPQLQRPPQISALKVDGKRSYKRVREGETVELAERPVTIHEFTVNRISDREYCFSLSCECGTYVRSVVRDMGEILGCGACLSALRREASYPFSVSQAKTFDRITLDDMLPWEELFPDAFRLELSQGAIAALSHGDYRRLYPEIEAGVITTMRGAGNVASTEGVVGKVMCIDGASKAPLGIIERNGSQWKVATVSGI